MLELHRVQVDGLPDPLDGVLVQRALVLEHLEVALELGAVELEVVLPRHRQQNADALGHVVRVLGNDQVVVRQPHHQTQGLAAPGLLDQLGRVLGLEDRVVEAAQHARNRKALGQAPFQLEVALAVADDRVVADEADLLDDLVQTGVRLLTSRCTSWRSR